MSTESSRSIATRLALYWVMLLRVVLIGYAVLYALENQRGYYWVSGKYVWIEYPSSTLKFQLTLVALAIGYFGCAIPVVRGVRWAVRIAVICDGCLFALCFYLLRAAGTYYGFYMIPIALLALLALPAEFFALRRLRRVAG